ncbi:glucose repression mediator protein [Linnemannia exigua]|uniref:Glucose repression mediator protein n=1 Tax=Linnemannia exigua TaxID=604196 RepID=A0AAD4DLN4_9FUNG|nr:glucose repression mediator protein [Linnemannia exigua]
MNAGPGPGPSPVVSQGPPPSGNTNSQSNNSNSHSSPAGPGPSGPQSAPGGGPAPIIPSPAQRLDAIDEQVWLQIGSLAESMGEFDRAMNSYESALRHNYQSVNALNLIAELYRSRENFPKAAEYFQRILAIDNASGEVWGSLGHCYLMMDELQKAYSAYQNALHQLPNPKDAKLWYGIGILYDRYGSVEHAEEAFSAVMRMDPKYEKANEIYFRLGIIYKGQQKYAQSLECFRYILHAPPRPLTEADIWFQIGHVHEQQKEYTAAKDAYERVLTENPNHAKVLQQLGWLYHQQNAAFVNQDQAINFLTRSIETDNSDAQSWYLMGRCYMAQQKYNKAYEAYQQAVYRDSKNPTFWCSIGLLYFQINQYRDALDAYSKAIRINPNISEVWFDLGALYEACNNQVNDAIDAYQRASDLDPENAHIKHRLAILRQNGADPSGPTPPYTEEMNPNAYQHNGGGPNGQHSFTQRSTVAPQGPPTGMQGYGGRLQPGPPPPPLMHDHQGRDLPPPGPGAGPSGHMVDEKQPHIPSINAARPPTPVGAMPQMMSGDRPPQAATLSDPAHVRPTQGPPRSPVPDGRPHGRHGSPSMAPPGSGHGHDPHYPPQHVYGPPPPRGMVQAGPHQGHDRQEEDPRMRHDHLQVHQHHRQRSGEFIRPGNMEESHNGPHPQRRHPSDPHAHAPTPPRDDRRPIPRPPSATGYHQQGPQHPEEQWARHGRHPSGDRSQDMQQQQHAGANRGPGYSRPPSRHEEYRHGSPAVPGRPPGAPGRGYPKEHYQRSSNNSPVPGGHPDYQRRDPREQGMSYEEQDQRHRGSGMEYEPEARPPPPPQDSRMADVPPAEQQDQDDIAASLVSLSGKGFDGSSTADNSSRHRARAEDDDYDMEEPDTTVNIRPSATQESKDQSSAPGSYGHHRDGGREQSVTPQSGSHTNQQQQQQGQGQDQNQDQGQSEDQAKPQHRGSTDEGHSKEGPMNTIRAQSIDSANTFVQAEESLPSVSRDAPGQGPKEDDEAMTSVESTSSTTNERPAPSFGQQSRDEQDHTAARSESSAPYSQDRRSSETSSTTAAVKAAPSVQAQSGSGDDMEMEEGEVREDEDEEDEVLSSGAVPTVAAAAVADKDDGAEEQT